MARIKNVTLTRDYKGKDGIFGSLRIDGGAQYQTLEHAYSKPSGDLYSKISLGNYVCIRGVHRLKNQTDYFETFEIMGVRNANGILFHMGNYQKDSDGCVLLGLKRAKMGGVTMVIQSKLALNQFMGDLTPLDRFLLKVVDPWAYQTYPYPMRG